MYHRGFFFWRILAFFAIVILALGAFSLVFGAGLSPGYAQGPWQGYAIEGGGPDGAPGYRFYPVHPWGWGGPRLGLFELAFLCFGCLFGLALLGALFALFRFGPWHRGGRPGWGPGGPGGPGEAQRGWQGPHGQHPGWHDPHAGQGPQGPPPAEGAEPDEPQPETL